MHQLFAAFTMLIFLNLYSYSQNQAAEGMQSKICLSKTEKEVARLINQYRVSKGLHAIPLSVSLSHVARVHAQDQTQNHKYKNRCNLHSWGDSDKWTSCCYTADHKQAQCMWDKPRELTKYQGDGFEISYFSTYNYSTPTEFAQDALQGWKNSPGHNNMIINLNEWKRSYWKAMGVGVYGDYINVWFGKIDDPAGAPNCEE